jgi:SAM-dependent methyltransferase
MPDRSWNSATWDGGYDWQGGGEEWSHAWGGSEAQWFGCIYPRIHQFLPADAVLEIGPGAGRWTRFLLPLTHVAFVGIDLSGECIRRCQDRFAGVPKAKFYVNDGLRLSSASDETFDFVFSFDSLVHAEMDVLETYIAQIMRKLRPNGTAFIHHSNWLGSDDSLANVHCRATSVSAERVAATIASCSGKVLLQEIVNWGGMSLIDCFSLFGRGDAADSEQPTVLRNNRFMDEAALIASVQSHYARSRRR